jgi:hypothetical protein
MVRDILGASVLAGETMLESEIKSACGSDLMSDVLAFVKEQGVLLTGLCNPQVVRTAEMMDIICVVFVRGKTPDERIIALARESGIAVMACPLTLYEACGRLYSAGLGRA